MSFSRLNAKAHHVPAGLEEAKRVLRKLGRVVEASGGDKTPGMGRCGAVRLCPGLGQEVARTAKGEGIAGEKKSGPPPERRAGRHNRRTRPGRRQTVGTDGGFLKMSWMLGMGGLRVRHGPKVILDESSYMRSGPYLNSDLRMSSHWTSPPL